MRVLCEGSSTQREPWIRFQRPDRAVLCVTIGRAETLIPLSVYESFLFRWNFRFYIDAAKGQLTVIFVLFIADDRAR